MRIYYWAYKAASGARHWLLRRYTAAGWFTLAAAVVTGIFATDLQRSKNYQLFSVLFGMFCVSGVMSLRFRGRFDIERRLPRFVTVGAPAFYRVMIHNHSSKTQKGLVYLEQPEDPRPDYEQFMEQRRRRRLKRRRFKGIFRGGRSDATTRQAAKWGAAPIDPIAPGGVSEVRVSITPLRRGRLRLAAGCVARTDPLGLMRAQLSIPKPGVLLVLPKRYFIPRLSLPGQSHYQQGGVTLSSSVGQSDEFIGLREYRQGDPLRHIHWRSWARMSKPVVKEYQDEYFVRHALVLDTFEEDADGELFEKAVSVAASLACAMQSQESLLDLLFVGDRAYRFTAGRGVGHVEQLLEILASVQASTESSFDLLEQAVVNHAPSVSGGLCVFLKWDEKRRGLVRRLRALEVPWKILVFAELESGETPDPGPMADQPGQFHVLDPNRLEEGLSRL